jgi:hypothetical protein
MRGFGLAGSVLHEWELPISESACALLAGVIQGYETTSSKHFGLKWKETIITSWRFFRISSDPGATSLPGVVKD